MSPFGIADSGGKVRPLVQADQAKSGRIVFFKSCRPACRDAVPLPRPAGENIHFLTLSVSPQHENGPHGRRAGAGWVSDIHGCRP